MTHAVPIYEGFAMPHSIMRVDVAGRDVTRYLKLLLRKEGVNFRTTAEFEIVRTIKERACYLARYCQRRSVLTSLQPAITVLNSSTVQRLCSNPAKEETLETERVQYTLPDGSSLDIGPARFRAPEVLFRSVSEPDLYLQQF